MRLSIALAVLVLSLCLGACAREGQVAYAYSEFPPTEVPEVISSLHRGQKTSVYRLITAETKPAEAAMSPKDIIPKATEEIQLTTLDNACHRSITANSPDAAGDLIGPEAHRDWNGDLAISWSGRSGEFFRDGEGGEALAAQAIAGACPSVAVVVYNSGPTGGRERWYIRRDEFAVRHSRDSGMPGDEDKYWHWDTLPFDYDPQKDYDQGGAYPQHQDKVEP